LVLNVNTLDGSYIFTFYSKHQEHAF